MSGRARAKFIANLLGNEFAGISFAPVMAWEVVVETECSKMTLSRNNVAAGTLALVRSPHGSCDARESKTRFTH